MGSTKLCGWLGLLFVVSSIVSFIGFSDNAKAASAFDDYYRTIDSLELSTPGYCESFDASNFVALINNPNYWNNETAYPAIQDAFINWQSNSDTVDINITVNDGGNVAFIAVDIDGNMTLNWSALDESVYYQGTNIFAVMINCDYSSGEYKIYHHQSGGGSTDVVSTRSTHYDPMKNYIYTGEANYPEGYDGQEINETIPGSKEDLYPHYTYLVNDKEIKATHDLTQELPELPEPDEGWQNNEWQVMWYLFKCSSIDDDDIIACPDRESVHSKLLHRDEIYEWEVDDYGDYLLTAEFRYQSCLRSPSWPETPDYCYLNSEHDEYSFVPGRTVPLYIDGNNIVGNTADLNCDVAGNCYDDTRFKNCNVIVVFATLSFDDFDYADCLKNIELLANMLSFNTIKFSNSWVSNGNCYTLGTLGNWLNLDNKHVCPYFSNEVRNTVTPFITFLLGLVMIKFIAGKGAHGSREVDI